MENNNYPDELVFELKRKITELEKQNAALVEALKVACIYLEQRLLQFDSHTTNGFFIKDFIAKHGG